MRPITTEAPLRAHIPNLIPAVKGEPSLLERLDSFLAEAERRAAVRFTGMEVFEAIVSMSGAELDPDPQTPFSLTALREALEAMVCCEALHRALPALDVVLTPNGFGVISSSNVAPASQHRVERLDSELVTRRDASIDSLLTALRACRAWHGTPQARYFADTLFPDLTVVDAVGCEGTSRWLAYQSLRPKLVNAETAIANKYISPELLAALRAETLRGTDNANRRRLAFELKAYIINKLTGARPHDWSLFDMVQFIRSCPDDFPEWHGSQTARLFSPPVFRNKKDSNGYWF